MIKSLIKFLSILLSLLLASFLILATSAFSQSKSTTVNSCLQEPTPSICMEKLAKTNNLQAQQLLALMYRSGSSGVKVNYDQAMYWATQSANQGYANSQALLALMYSKGQGVEKNYTKSIYWATKSAKQGSQNGQTVLGFLYYQGDGVVKNYKQAYAWLRISQNNGDPSPPIILNALKDMNTHMSKDQITQAQELAQELTEELKKNLNNPQP